MDGLLLGVETEYALVGPGQLKSRLNRVAELLRQKTRYLSGGNDRDLFLENGSRFYVDNGGHPEWATPECSSPTELLRYIQAGEALLADVMGEVALTAAPAARAALFRCNVDYSGARTTWGSHESYLYRSNPKLFPDQLIPHLASRLIYTGAGGFNPLSGGLEFTLSPRSWHLQHAVSPESTGERGIFHTKDESLSRHGTHRLHLICGESLCSEIATWLRVGTTALVVAMIDAGLNPGTPVRLRYPMNALRTFAEDTSCRSTALLVDGRQLTALGIQRHYLTESEHQLSSGRLPSWAEAVCREWRAMLDKIERGHDALSSTLDWTIKYAVYRHHAARRGIPWSELPALNHVAGVIDGALKRSEYKGEPDIALLVDETRPENPIRDTVRGLAPFLAAQSLGWGIFLRFWKLRHELFEADMRFGQIGPHGIFNRLDRAGVLDHRLEGIGPVDEAKHRPPVTGRARVRGLAVRRYVGRPGYQCYWDHIWDLKGERIMDFSDPFTSRVLWKKMPSEGPPEERILRRRFLREFNTLAESLFV